MLACVLWCSAKILGQVRLNAMFFLCPSYRSQNYEMVLDLGHAARQLARGTCESWLSLWTTRFTASSTPWNTDCVSLCVTLRNSWLRPPTDEGRGRTQGPRPCSASKGSSNSALPSQCQQGSSRPAAMAGHGDSSALKQERAAEARTCCRCCSWETSRVPEACTKALPLLCHGLFDWFVNWEAFSH